MDTQICVFGSNHCSNVPNVQEKYTLKEAGLGEKKIVFKLNGDYDNLKVESCYAKLVELFYFVRLVRI